MSKLESCNNLEIILIVLARGHGNSMLDVISRAGWQLARFREYSLEVNLAETVDGLGSRGKR